MKSNQSLALIAALSLSFAAASFAQSASQAMGDMPMKSKGKSDCMGMEGMKGKDMAGMDMKDMDHQKCMDMMKGADKKHATKASKTQSHQADAVVKAVDPSKGKVTLEHEPVKTLGWPAMTMGFAVKDKALFDKLAVGSKVHVEFKKDKNDYVVTAVK
jgi:Cu/Ag efflux protein CusF